MKELFERLGKSCEIKRLHAVKCGCEISVERPNHFLYYNWCQELNKYLTQASVKI